MEVLVGSTGTTIGGEFSTAVFSDKGGVTSWV